MSRCFEVNSVEKLKAIIVGAGNRGNCYSYWMSEGYGNFEVVAVVDPVKARRESLGKRHNVPFQMLFESWEDIIKKEKFADVVFICTMDRNHLDPTLAMIEKGYNILLEKPIAPTPEECIRIKDAAKVKGVKVLVCHVLRYTNFFKKVKEIIDSGKLGRVMSIEHDECVGHTHQAHSFVRGNWSNSEESSSMLLQKSCHDMDILQWLVGKKCKRVQSFGSRTYFTAENAPKDAPDYCIDNCPYSETCYYNAVKFYEEVWYQRIITKNPDPTVEEVDYALRNTQYGKCVFKCDNDVVDHQVVNLEFEDGCLANFNMCAFNEGGRHLRIMGTKGELSGSAGERMLDFFSFDTRKHEEIDTNAGKEGIQNGHGGGDPGIINALYEYLTDSCTDSDLSTIDISSENHMIVFAAEESRLSGKVIDVSEYTMKVINNIK